MKTTSKALIAISFLTQSLILITNLHGEDIGQGYSCSSNKIFKKNKEVKLSKAKLAIQTKIDAVKGNSAKAKNKKAELKEIKTNLAKCTKGTFTGGGGSNVDEGTFVGTYSGDLTFVSVTASGQGCKEDASTFWKFYIGRPDNGKIIFAATTPFGGVADEGGPVNATSFKYLTNKGQPFSLSRYFEATGSDLTQNSVTITLVQTILKQGNVACKATFTGVMNRDPSDPYAD